jgi:hypothetical protein
MENQDKQYIAIVVEKGSSQGQIIGNTKNGIYKGLDREQFETELKKHTAFAFKIEEIKPQELHKHCPK